ncbi:MAG: bifunctional phosphoglucose/phosphomannose isomerase [Nanobdellota archaeon]
MNYDKEDMYSVLKNFPEQIDEGIKLAKDIKAEGDFDKIFFLGMGGSALPGDMMKDYLTELPVYVVKGYNIPKFMDEKSLVFAISYSGNTEETISAFREASKTKAKMITISSGGKLEELSKVTGCQHIKVPKGIQPRQAIGYQFFPPFMILQNSGIIEDKSEEIKNTKNVLKKDIYDGNGKELALKLYNKIPLIYSSDRMSTIAEKWKISFNENAKMQAFHNVFPELNHNEMNSYINLNGEFYTLIIKDEDDLPRVKKRMKITKELIREKGVDVVELVLRGDYKLAKLLSSMYMSDWVAYHTALLLETDPTPVDMVEDFKKRLKE